MKQLPPSISVIMPVYNEVDYIREAIDSILNQIFSNFEFIIVDDASDDGTQDVILSYTDKRIIYIRNERNLGNYPSRNIGIRQAKGKYIAVMDADDVAFPERLEQQFIYMEAHPEICATGSWFLFGDEESKRMPPVECEKIRITLLNNNCFMHASLIVRAESMYKLEGYNEKYYYSADYDLLCRLAIQGEITNMPVVLMKYRWHPNQITQKHSRKQQMYANEIRLHYQCNFIERYKTGKIQSADKYAVMKPELGYLIALYVYARYTGEKSYEERADILLEEVTERIAPGASFDTCLIGCAILYLLRNGLAEGDEDEIVQNIDRELQNASPAFSKKDKKWIYGWIHYLILRITKEGLSGNEPNYITNKQNLICLTNYLDNMDWDEADEVLKEDLRKIRSILL